VFLQIPELAGDGFWFAVDIAPDEPGTARVVPFESSVRGVIRAGTVIAGRLSLRPHQGDLFLGLTPRSGVLEYDGLSFGFVFSDGDGPLAQQQWPVATERYISSDQPWLISEKVDYLPDTRYSLTLWSEDGGQRYEAVYHVLTPKPDRPYPSWTWDGSAWQPPIPPPDDGSWEWDEAGQQWVAAE
jgi:hypothetical protein